MAGITGISKFFRRDTAPPAESTHKNLPNGDLEQKMADGGVGFMNFLQSNSDNWDISFAVLIQYYKRCAPFANAVDLISDAVSEIPIHLKNLQTNEYEDNHPVMALLAYPNDNMSKEDFIKHLSGMYSIVGSPWLESIGNINRPPLSLDIINPQYTEIEPDRAGDPDRVRYMNEFQSVQFNARSVGGRRRFQANGDREIWPVFAFNPDRGSRQFFGMPIAKPLYNDIEQYIYSGRHNKSLLKRGARPGGMFRLSNPEYPLTDEQRKRLQDQLDAYFSGPDNAGRPLVAEGLEFQENITNNKDMDYKTLISNATEACYRQYKIPLPLIKSETMTLSNYETSQVAFYDIAVLPHARFLLSQLGMALLYRYDPEWRTKYRFVYDQTEITALQQRRNENVKMQKDVGVSSTNELREQLGLDPADDGDTIWIPNNLVPLDTQQGSEE